MHKDNEEKVQIKSTKCAHNHDHECNCNHDHNDKHSCNCNHDKNHDCNCSKEQEKIVVEKYVIPADEAPVTQEDVNKMEAEFDKYNTLKLRIAASIIYLLLVFVLLWCVICRLIYMWDLFS